MSLDNGVMLCRLNHELFPDPGNPMARITVPLGTRGAAAGAGFAADGATGATPSPSVVASAGTALDGAIPPVLEPPLPRPPRPRRRRRRASPPVPPPSRCG